MVKRPQIGVDSIVITPTDAATAELTGNLDCQDANYATIRVLLGAEANTNSTNVPITISESDDTVVTNFATFDATLNRTVDNAAAAVATSHIDLKARKRYLRVTVTPDTTTNGAVEIAVMGTLEKNVQSGTASDFGDDVIYA